MKQVVKPILSEWNDLPVDVNSEFDVIYAIGDVHGMKNLLDHHHATIDAISKNDQNICVVHLGDYIDRGPDPVACLRSALTYKRDRTKTIVLPGNHEQFLHDVVTKRDVGLAKYWIKTSGLSTIMDTGLFEKQRHKMHPTKILIDDEKIAFIIDKLADFFDEDIKALKGLPAGAMIGNLVFLHAGVPYNRQPHEMLNYPWSELGNHPNRSAAQKSPLWVRSDFLDRTKPFKDGKLVVHGHTIFDEPIMTPTRLSLDTGAFNSNCLTMAEIRNNKVRFHTTDIYYKR